MFYDRFRMKNKYWICAFLLVPVVGCAQDSNPSESVKDKALSTREGNYQLNAVARTDLGNYFDVRSFGVKPDKKTDWTNKIDEIIKEIGPNSTLYIPSGVDWDYRGVYSKMKDYQTIIDDSGRDKPRKVWQNSRYIWYKTNSETEKTSGNTFGIAGNYHPAFFIDTWSDGINGRRSSVIFRDHGEAKWQLVSNPGSDIRDFSIVQYGSKVYGTRSLVIGHQDGPAWGKYAFNAPISKNTTTSYTFGKPPSVKENDAFSTQYSRPDTDTGGFTQIYKYGNDISYRTDILKDGTKIDTLKNDGKITTNSNGAITGSRLNIIAPKSSIALTKDKSGSFVSNVNASGAILITLPKAEPGINYEISVDSKNSISIKPNGFDSLAGLASGQALQSASIQSKVKLVAVSNSVWSVQQNGVWSNR
ncbi:hypothetical protein GCM10007354_02860 [Acinetobacter courvalinii]|uniref:Uncharacterized protein n=2 Tax=Acinetobacter courvalinii TaxID=280147 RepID=A0ABD0A369_9GAMM|nr:hypothetical protein GCM10007354_02860 [Acinetobacter courvalinii]